MPPAFTSHATLVTAFHRFTSQRRTLSARNFSAQMFHELLAD
jgi:hypothetical protein